MTSVLVIGNELEGAKDQESTLPFLGCLQAMPYGRVRFSEHPLPVRGSPDLGISAGCMPRYPRS